MPPIEPTIADYDTQSADEITQRLRKLSRADLAKLEAYEKKGQARSTVLERIAALRGAEDRAEQLAKDMGHAVGSAAKETGGAVGAVAGKAKRPALMGGAVLAALGSGTALGRGSKVKLHKRKWVLGVPTPRRTTVGKAAKRVGQAVDGVSSTGQQIGDWSDAVQDLHRTIAGGRSSSPAEKLTGGR